MKSYKALTGRYLKTQKRRTALTIIGIILSVALISAIGTMISSSREVLIENTIEDGGNWHIKFDNVSGDNLGLIKNNINIEDASITSRTGVAPINKTSDEDLEADGNAPPYTYLVIDSYDDSALDMLPVKIKEGRKPEEPGEIIIDYWALDFMPGKPELGDTITLDIGMRKGKASSYSDPENHEADEKWDNVAISSDIPLEDETFESKGHKEYTIVGLIQPKFEWSRNYFPTAIEYLDNKSIPINQKYTIHSTLKIIKDVEDKANTIIEDAGLKDVDIHYHNRLLSLSFKSVVPHIDAATLAILIFIISVIVIATIAVIYNAFNISVLERISQFGILRSVGASPNQIKRMVLKEAFIVSLIGIPIGLFCGVFAMQIVMGFVKRFGFDVFDNFKVTIDPTVFIISSIIGLMTVYLSALGPARRASRISPLEAIRNTGDFKKDYLTKVKSGRLARLLFGTKGQIAYKNLARNKRRFNITVFSMSISIILFIVFSSLITFFFKASSTTFTDGADFILYESGRRTNATPLTDMHYEELMELEEVDRVYRTGEFSIITIVPEDKINPKFDEATRDSWKSLNDEDSKIDSSMRKIYNNSIIKMGNENLEMLKPFLLQGQIDSETLNSQNGVILIRDSNVYNENTKRYSLMPVTTLKLGDTIDISFDYYESDEDYTIETLNIVGIVEKGILDFEFNLNGGLYLITSDELFDEHDIYPHSFRWNITLKNGAHKEPVLKYIKELAENNRGVDFWDIEAEAREDKNAAVIMSVFLYGFVAIITLISSLNIINTISTNLLLRTRELAMFKAVGMSQRGVK
ncbi:MAG: ABC transporter permease, partial [Clostridiales bacterium]|nr:ABC transporter permease [Clostridiales bacterium]